MIHLMFNFVPKLLNYIKHSENYNSNERFERHIYANRSKIVKNAIAKCF